MAIFVNKNTPLISLTQKHNTVIMLKVKRFYRFTCWKKSNICSNEWTQLTPDTLDTKALLSFKILCKTDNRIRKEGAVHFTYDDLPANVPLFHFKLKFDIAKLHKINLCLIIGTTHRSSGAINPEGHFRDAFCLIKPTASEATLQFNVLLIGDFNLPGNKHLNRRDMVVSLVITKVFFIQQLITRTAKFLPSQYSSHSNFAIN